MHGSTNAVSGRARTFFCKTLSRSNKACWAEIIPVCKSKLSAEQGSVRGTRKNEHGHVLSVVAIACLRSSCLPWLAIDMRALYPTIETAPTGKQRASDHCAFSTSLSESTIRVDRVGLRLQIKCHLLPTVRAATPGATNTAKRANEIAQPTRAAPASGWDAARATGASSRRTPAHGARARLLGWVVNES